LRHLPTNGVPILIGNIHIAASADGCGAGTGDGEVKCAVNSSTEDVGREDGTPVFSYEVDTIRGAPDAGLLSRDNYFGGRVVDLDYKPKVLRQ